MSSVSKCPLEADLTLSQIQKNWKSNLVLMNKHLIGFDPRAAYLLVSLWTIP